MSFSPSDWADFGRLISILDKAGWYVKVSNDCSMDCWYVEIDTMTDVALGPFCSRGPLFEAMGVAIAKMQEHGLLIF